MKQQSNKKRPENASASLELQNFPVEHVLGPPRVEGPSGLRQIYPPVTLKHPLVQKLIETPDLVHALLGRWPCYISGQEQNCFPPLGTKLHFHVNSL